MDKSEMLARIQTNPTYPLIRASQASQVLESEFVLWADVHADQSKKDELDAFQELLFEKGNIHEQEVVLAEFADATELRTQASIADTITQMCSGVDVLLQAPLLIASKGLQGRPDVLIKESGTSVFGDYYYSVQEIKYAKNIKDKHRIQAAFYTYLIGLIQQKTPETFTLINQESERFTYAFADYKDKLLSAITRAKQVLCSEDMPLPVYGEDWPWKSYSKELAKELDDVSLLYRLGRSVRKRLHKQNIFTLADLQKAPKEVVLSVKGVGKSTYTKWMRQIQAFRSQEAICVRTPQLPVTSQPLFFDIEGDTQRGVDYLYGVFDGDSFVSFFADTPSDEEQMWNTFLTYIDGLADDAKLFHYTSYEKTSINRLYELYGGDKEVIKKLKHMLVDLFPIVTRNFSLPLTKYSIKPVAQFLDFSWRADDAGGANSLQWYEQFLSGDQKMKTKILDYNEDDVRATKVVYEWILSYM